MEAGKLQLWLGDRVRFVQSDGTAHAGVVVAYDFGCPVVQLDHPAPDLAVESIYSIVGGGHLDPSLRHQHVFLFGYFEVTHVNGQEVEHEA